MLRYLRNLVRYRRFRKANDFFDKWLSANEDAVCACQLRQLRRKWEHTVRGTPYYANLVKERRAPQHIESLEQFTKEVPVVYKEDVVANPHLFVRTDRRPDGFSVTGGSTGEPLRIGTWKTESLCSAVDKWLGRIAYGMPLDAKVFLIWGHEHTLEGGPRGTIQRLKRAAKDRVIGYKRVSAYDLTPVHIRQILEKLHRYRPAVVIGYSTALDAVVRISQDCLSDTRELGVRLVVATGEVLPYSDSRHKIERFFNAPLAMEYGAHDFGMVAYTLPQDGYRVFWHNVLAESIGRNPDEQQLAVTCLYDRYFPAIRYATGDMVVNPRFSADGTMMGFDELLGRCNEVIKLASGKQLHAFVVEDCVMNEPGVQRFQCILRDRSLDVVLVGKRDRIDTSAIRRRMERVSRELAQARFVFSKDVEPTAAGKRRWIVDLRTKRAAGYAAGGSAPYSGKAGGCV